MPTCKLCLQEKELIRAHIIPDFMHQDLWDEKHRIFEFTGTDLLSDEPTKKKTRQTGVYDREILCANCDNVLLGSLEQYASDVLYGNPSLNISLQDLTQPDGMTWREASPVDYTKFKLFLLSLLWRASITTQSFFSSVDLGNTHEENLRQMIFGNDARQIHDYPIALLHYSVDEKDARGLISSFQRHKKGYCHYYSILLAGVLIIYHLKSECLPSQGWLEFGVTLENTLKIIHMPGGGLQFMADYINGNPSKSLRR